MGVAHDGAEGGRVAASSSMSSTISHGFLDHVTRSGTFRGHPAGFYTIVGVVDRRVMSPSAMVGCVRTVFPQCRVRNPLCRHRGVRGLGVIGRDQSGHVDKHRWPGRLPRQRPDVHVASSGLGLCQWPSGAIRSSASFDP